MKKDYVMNVKSQLIIFTCAANIFVISCARVGIIEKSFLNQFLPKNPIILEGGAHVGYDTLEMQKLWPESKIFTFEAHPVLFSKLLQNTKQYPNISCFPLALSNKKGRALFYLSGFGSTGASSLLEPTLIKRVYPFIVFRKKTWVDTITLDSWLLEHNLDHIDLLWISLSGAEPMVLKCSSETLQRTRVIYTQVNYNSLYKEAIAYPDYKAFLQKNGFNEIYEIHPHGPLGKVLFVKSDKHNTEIYQSPINRSVEEKKEEEEGFSDIEYEKYCEELDETV